MSRIRDMRPAAMVVAVIALVMALGGTGFAAKKLLKLGSLTDGAKNKTVGVGKLTYVQNTQSVDTGAITPTNNGRTITANCPSGTRILGGGTKTATTPSTSKLNVFQEYPTATGWTSVVYVTGPPAEQITVTAICGISRAVTGTPPAS